MELVLPNSIYKANITLIQKPGKDVRKKSCRPIFLMSRDAKTLNKIFIYRIQQHFKNIINHDQVGLIPEKQGWYGINESVNTIHK
jgi:hypothetical protein